MSTYHVKIKAAYKRSGNEIHINEIHNFTTITAAQIFAAGYAEGLSWTIDLIRNGTSWHDIHGNKIIWIEHKIEV